MSRGVNKAIIVGTLGQDPETRYTASGSAVTNISVATNESWKDKDGQQQEKTEWHKIVMFGKLAEIAAQYLKKGSQAYFEGRIETSKYQAQDGSDRYSTQINANQMQMLGGKGEQKDQQVQQKPQAAGAGEQFLDDVARKTESPAPDDFMDDIPF